MQCGFEIAQHHFVSLAGSLPTLPVTLGRRNELAVMPSQYEPVERILTAAHWDFALTAFPVEREREQKPARSSLPAGR